MRCAAALVAITVAGCSASPSDRAVQACEDQLMAKLKSPASYKRVKVDSFTVTRDIHDPPYYQVNITYDAANAYNALLRDQESCFYQPGTVTPIDPFGLNSIGDADVNAATDSAEDALATANRAIANAQAAIDAANLSLDQK